MKLLRTVFGTLRHVERTVFLNALIRLKLEQLLRARSHQVGRSRAAENAEDT